MGCRRVHKHTAMTALCLPTVVLCCLLLSPVRAGQVHPSHPIRLLWYMLVS